MSLGNHRAKFLVLAREVEGQALLSNKIATICWFILEAIIVHYGYFNRLWADREKMDTNKTYLFFLKYYIGLKLTIAYNLESNGKSERGHLPIVNTLVKTGVGYIILWPNLLSFTLMASGITISLVIGFSLTQLMNKHLSLMPIKMDITSGCLIKTDQMTRENIIA